jgi:nicotinic acid mononucleotide adenylyltransferase
MDWLDLQGAAQASGSNPITEVIKGRILKELSDMAEEIDIRLSASPFKEIWADAEFYLDLITSQLNNREVIPVSITKPHEESEKAESERTLRVGFYPVSADPLHWGHLLIGLSAMARFKLDKVVYAIAGHDPRKPEMTPPTARHPMGQSILNMFTPLFEYSPVALEDELDGESSLFKMLALHGGRRIKAFYIAGSDHCRRVDPVTGSADTIQKLEEHVRSKMYGFDGRRQRISLIFVKRDPAECSINTRLNVSYIPSLPFNASSTVIRWALAGRESRDKLALLPYTAYLYIRALGLYVPSRQVGGKGMSLPVKRVA